jgi:hypothetical protein
MNTYTGGVLSERAAAELLACTVHAMRAWRYRRQGPPFCRVGRLVRYMRSDLEQFLAGNRTQPGDGRGEQ